METDRPHYVRPKPFKMHDMQTEWAFEMFTKLCSFHSVMFRYHLPCKSVCMNQNNWNQITLRFASKDED